METLKEVIIYTDGACSGNPGPGGWGAILRYKNTEKEISGGEANTTNNRMELTGAIAALKMLKEGKVTLPSIELYECKDFEKAFESRAFKAGISFLK